MLSALGLALNVVGAGALSIGLFRPSRPLFPGWSRNPLAAATDYAFGVTGFIFLAAGFLLQALPHFGVQATNCVGASEAAAAGGLIGGTIVAWVICEVLRAIFFRKERRRPASPPGSNAPGAVSSPSARSKPASTPRAGGSFPPSAGVAASTGLIWSSSATHL